MDVSARLKLLGEIEDQVALARLDLQAEAEEETLRARFGAIEQYARQLLLILEREEYRKSA